MPRSRQRSCAEARAHAVAGPGRPRRERVVLSYFQAIVMGLLQGVTELFPISSLGHSVLLPKLLGWDDLVKAQSQESFFLAFLVALHVGTAIALIIFFRRDWARILRGFFHTFSTRRIETPDERLAWLLVVATIPAGIVGLVLEHELRVVFAKPFAAAVFLTVNGFILLGGEVVRRRSAAIHEMQVSYPQSTTSREPGRRLDTLDFKESFVVGVAQVGALFAGISRSGITMVAGLVRGLDHEDAARFSFLLATPIILAAGVYKLPDLFGHLGNGVRGQSLVGAISAGVAAYFSVRFLVRFFETKTLWPFGIYCIVAGIFCMIAFA
jgi:undecaprenyl-diphosphatase